MRITYVYAYTGIALGWLLVDVMLLIPVRPSCPSSHGMHGMPKVTYKGGRTALQPDGCEICVWEWQVGCCPQSPDPILPLPVCIQAQGASPRSPWASLGSRLARRRGRSRPAPRGTRPPWFLETVESFAFWALLKPDLQPGLRDSLQRGPVTLNNPGNRHHRSPSSGSAVPTLLSLLPPPPMRW